MKTLTILLFVLCCAACLRCSAQSSEAVVPSATLDALATRINAMEQSNRFYRDKVDLLEKTVNRMEIESLVIVFVVVAFMISFCKLKARTQVTSLNRDEKPCCDQKHSD